MVTTFVQFLHIRASEPDQHCGTTAAIAESFTSDKMVKKPFLLGFTAFYGIFS